MMTAEQFASCLRGKVISGGVSFAPPGHRDPKDASGRLLIDPAARNGYKIVCLSPRDDALQVRDYVDATCGLPRFEPGAGRHEQRQRDPHEVAQQERARAQQRQVHAAERARRAQRLWHEARDPVGSPVEVYLRSRGLELLPEVAGEALRYHEAAPWLDDETGEIVRVPAMVAVMRDIISNEITGVHRTRLGANAEKLGRKMSGAAGAAAVKLTPDADVALGLAVAEGVESALAGMMLGVTPMWALGSVGAIAAFPVLPGVEVLTVCGETGEASEAAVQRVGVRWTEAGREVRVCLPRYGSDLNDAIREAGH